MHTHTHTMSVAPAELDTGRVLVILIFPHTLLTQHCEHEIPFVLDTAEINGQLSRISAYDKGTPIKTEDSIDHKAKTSSYNS